MPLTRLAAVALGASFLWAGVAKLADPRWPGAATAFGVSVAVARVVAPFELVLGAVLTTLRGPGPGAIAFGVLVLYTGLIVRQIRSGAEAPPCACFGGATRRPVSWRTVARNAALLVLAALAVAG